jgi:predicted nucleotidyltransferase
VPDELEAVAAAEADVACGPSEGYAAEEAVFLGVFEETVGALEDAGIPYVLMGGVASATVGRPRITRDIDAFVRPADARQVLEVLGREGFRTEERFPHWLYKAWKRGILVDVIFRSGGDIYLDEEMLDRSTAGEFKGRRFRLIPPEDLLVIKAIVHDEHMPRHWHDALGIVAGYELDWDYLVRRARHGARRVLSLLLYAQSNDLLVPAHVLRQLFAMIDEVQLAGDGRTA